MISWLGGLFGRGFRKISDLAGSVERAVKGIWHALTDLGHLVGRGWDYLYGGVQGVALFIARIPSAVYNLGRHIIFELLPRWLRKAIDSAATFARRLVTDLKNLALGTIAAVRDFILRVVHTLESWARSAVRWITDRVHELLDLAGRMARLVFTLLTSPVRLAAWLAGAMWREFLRLLVLFAVPIARWFLGAFVRVSLGVANTIEDVIAQLF